MAELVACEATRRDKAWDLRGIRAHVARLAAQGVEVPSIVASGYRAARDPAAATPAAMLWQQHASPTVGPGMRAAHPPRDVCPEHGQARDVCGLPHDDEPALPPAEAVRRVAEVRDDLRRQRVAGHAPGVAGGAGASGPVTPAGPPRARAALGSTTGSHSGSHPSSDVSGLDVGRSRLTMTHPDDPDPSPGPVTDRVALDRARPTQDDDKVGAAAKPRVRIF